MVIFTVANTRRLPANKYAILSVIQFIKINKISKKFIGSSNPNSKLTLLKVRKIKHLYASGNYTYKELGDIYNVHPTTIGVTVRGKTKWGSKDKDK